MSQCTCEQAVKYLVMMLDGIWRTS